MAKGREVQGKWASWQQCMRDLFSRGRQLGGRSSCTLAPLRPAGRLRILCSTWPAVALTSSPASTIAGPSPRLFCSTPSIPNTHLCCSLNLLSCLVTAAVAAMASGDGGKAVLVPQLAVLGLLPLLASVLHGWAVKLQAEGQHFGAEEGRGGEGGSGGGSPAAAGSGGAAGPMMGHEKLPAGKRGGSVSTGPAAESTSPAAAAAAAAINDSGLEGDAAAGGAVAAEVTEQAVLEALALLEALAADEAGEASLNASGDPEGSGQEGEHANTLCAAIHAWRGRQHGSAHVAIQQCCVATGRACLCRSSLRAASQLFTSPCCMQLCHAPAPNPAAAAAAVSQVLLCSLYPHPCSHMPRLYHNLRASCPLLNPCPCAAPIKDALLRTVAEADQRSTQALATSLLAGLEGVGPQLLAQPAALAALLRRLATAAAERPGKRAKTNGEAGSGGGSVVVAAAAAGPGSEEEQAEEVEATWALCSALARAVSAEAETGAGGEEAAGEQGQLGAAAPALGVMAEQMDALCHDWSSSPRAAAIQMHQAYVLRRLGPLLEPRVEGPGKQALRGALARCEAATVPA